MQYRIFQFFFYLAIAHAAISGAAAEQQCSSKPYEQAFYEAAMNDDMQTLESLLAKDPSLANTRYPDGITPLILRFVEKRRALESFNGYALDTFRCILKKSATTIDINAVDVDGNTAFTKGPWGIQEILIKYKANINHRNKSKKSALCLALEQEYWYGATKLSHVGLSLSEEDCLKLLQKKKTTTAEESGTTIAEERVIKATFGEKT